jgi:hypothetical protein
VAASAFEAVSVSVAEVASEAASEVEAALEAAFELGLDSDPVIKVQFGRPVLQFASDLCQAALELVVPSEASSEVGPSEASSEVGPSEASSEVGPSEAVARVVVPFGASSEFALEAAAAPNGSLDRETKVIKRLLLHSVFFDSSA